MPRKFVLIPLLFLIAMTVHAKWDFRGEDSENYSQQNIQLQIASDKTRFRYNENMRISLRITNNGFYPATLYLHRDDRKNFVIIAKGKNGLSIPVLERAPQENIIKSGDPFYESYSGTGYQARSMVLKPGETIEKIISLKEWIDLPQNNKSETYLISAFFYPNPDQSQEYFLTSENQYTIFVDPVSEEPRTQSAYFNVDKGTISPREVVFLALASEYKDEWPSYFKYISEPDLIKAYPDFAYKYARASETDKNGIIHDFMEYLKNRKTHELKKFSVLEEKITDILHSPVKTAEVTVKATRDIEGYDREFVYTYYLTSRNHTWLITGIETQVVK